MDIVIDCAKQPRNNSMSRNDNTNVKIARLVKSLRDARKLPEHVEQDVVSWLQEHLEDFQQPNLAERILGSQL